MTEAIQEVPDFKNLLKEIREVNSEGFDRLSFMSETRKLAKLISDILAGVIRLCGTPAITYLPLEDIEQLYDVCKSMGEDVLVLIDNTQEILLRESAKAGQQKAKDGKGIFRKRDVGYVQ